MLELAIALILLSFFFGIFSTWYVVSLKEQNRTLQTLHVLSTACGFLEQCRMNKVLPKNGEHTCNDVTVRVQVSHAPGMSRFHCVHLIGSLQDSEVEIESGIFL